MVFCRILIYPNKTWLHTVVDLHSKILDVRPSGSKFFPFHAVFGKFWQNRMLAPPGELAPPPQGNPGSNTAINSIPTIPIMTRLLIKNPVPGVLQLTWTN